MNHTGYKFYNRCGFLFSYTKNIIQIYVEPKPLNVMKHKTLIPSKGILVLFAVLFTISNIVIAQGVVIEKEETKTQPHESSIFEIRSSDKGILIPRLTSDERNGIENPADGLIVYDINEKSFYYYSLSEKDGQGEWIRTMTGKGNIEEGVPGRMAFWDNATTIRPHERIEVAGSAKDSKDDPIFVVKNDNGDKVFAVYQKGVRIYVDDSEDEDKTARGGFAVGGFTSQKDHSGIDFLRVTRDSVRIYVNAEEGKTARGGFAVGGFTSQKGFQDLLRVTPDSTRIYIDDRPGKTARGGFAVGGFTSQKNMPGSSFFNVETVSDESVIVTPSEPRILWYPLKNAFLAGQVLIENPEDVGFNSLSIGYETKASGNRSQAFGFMSQALGDYSTAIGKNALADNNNSFAFGDHAQALGEDAFAFGSFSIAQGNGSYAFGSLGVDSLGNVNADIQTTAAGDHALAFGLGALAGGDGALAIGTGVNAYGPYSVAMGYNASTYNMGSVSMGWNSEASGVLSFASGFLTQAEGYGSIAMGEISVAHGNKSVVIGSHLNALSAHEIVIGSFNEPYMPVSPNDWIPTDRLFVIGNADPNNPEMGSNALTILKNGNMGVQDITSPAYSVQLPNNAMPDGFYGRGMATEWVTYSDKRIKSDKKVLEYGLDEVLKLQPVEYFHHSSVILNNQLSVKESGCRAIGLIAQDVYSIIPEVVSKPQNDSDELWGMSYEKLVPVLINAIKEQQEIINKQNVKIENFEKRLESIEELIK